MLIDQASQRNLTCGFPRRREAFLLGTLDRTRPRWARASSGTGRPSPVRLGKAPGAAGDDPVLLQELPDEQARRVENVRDMERLTGRISGRGERP
ncbi:MAG: hypothetical protein ACLT8E_09500 [Akkermansia sp.]